MTATNTLDAIDVIPSGKALSAEVRGVDFAKPMPDDVQDEVKRLWAEHLVLLFRRQKLDDDQLLAAAEIFGGQQEAGSRGYFLKAGHKPGETHRVAERAGISIVSNLDKDGNPVKFTEAVGSLELKWHSDNSYIEVPPAGSLLHSHIVPVNGGGVTSFNNQYLAYETLPDDLRQRIEGKHIRHDNMRNTAGRFRPTVEPPTSRDDIKGPAHPIVRIHPVTGRRALYLGRHYEFPSSHIVELDDAESEEVLGQLWDHATQDSLKWSHDWAVGDLVLWDNRCTMHARTPIDHTQPRVLHRVLIKGEPVISAWGTDAAAE
jgi:taurine dioxygenase